MGIPKNNKITKKQEIFCREYIYEYNATRSYLKAFPKVKVSTAGVEGCKLLKNPKIKEYLAELQSNLEEVAGISRLKVLQEHQKLAFSSIAYLHDTWITRVEFEKLTDEQKSCISEISTQTRFEKGANEETMQVDYVKIRLYDKQKALDSITRMMGYNVAEKMDVTSKGESVNKITGIEIIRTKS